MPLPLVIEYCDGGRLKVVQQDPNSFGYGELYTKGPIRISSMDITEVRLRQNVLFVRGVSDKLFSRSRGFDVDFTLENITKINTAILNYNDHMARTGEVVCT